MIKNTEEKGKKKRRRIVVHDDAGVATQTNLIVPGVEKKRRLEDRGTECERTLYGSSVGKPGVEENNQEGRMRRLGTRTVVLRARTCVGDKE